MALAGASRPALPGVRGKKPRTPGSAGVGKNGVRAHTGRGHRGRVNGSGVVTARERGVVVDVLMMVVVAVEVVYAGVSVDETGREEGDHEEGDTVEAVDVGVSACV
ncbi:hypothetical protein NDU88_007244 [Pleurodeles waltl]|uniref:Uncharacterized protein n=1 Tax=Pleurodeles waltl TaxID=8319 RepID=A0AAV7U2H0_PLEWA|nr:hypothetical protein NDU88_007244 [Pleurodeles waltl]